MKWRKMSADRRRNEKVNGSGGEEAEASGDNHRPGVVLKRKEKEKRKPKKYLVKLKQKETIQIKENLNLKNLEENLNIKNLKENLN